MASHANIKMVSYDILLTHTSQEMFGRQLPSKNAKKSRTGRKDVESSKKKLLSKSLQYPSAASDDSSSSGLNLACQLDRSHIEHNLRLGNDLEEVNKIKASFQQKLQDINDCAVAPQRETAVQRKKRIVLLTLQMPNFVRLLVSISCQRCFRMYSQAMSLWKTTTVSLRALEKIMYGRKLEAAMRVRRAWLRRRAWKKEEEKRRLAMRAQHKKERLAAKKIARGLLRVLRRRTAQKIVMQRRVQRRIKSAAKIQAVWRGLLGRASRTEQLRLILLQDLREWAGGNMQKLITRPST